MMNIPVISQLPQDVATAVLIVLLIVVFVIAFKIMKMVFETITVSVLSAVFYIALTQLFSFSFSFNQMLTYAFMGAVFYMAYSFLASAYSLAQTVLKIPYHIIMIGLYPFKKLYSKAREEIKIWNYRRKNNKSVETDNSTDSGSTKEVVLDKVKKDKEEE